MASPEVEAQIEKLEDLTFSTQNRPAAYSDLLQRINTDRASSTYSSDITAFIQSILGESLGIVAARPLLASAVQSIKSIPIPDLQIQIGTAALEALQPRAVSFEEQDAELRLALAGAYEASEDWLSSAKVLQAINLESSQRKITEENKIETWIRICRLYLEEDDTTTAESYLNRAKNIIYKLPPTSSSRTHFQLCQARILDSQRRFLDASSAYHEISFNPLVEEDERLKTLSMAITCAVLAPAGPQRSRSLAKLYKDERAPQVPEYSILEKMFLDRLLSAEEVSKFAAGLAPHQVAKTGDGSTVLDKAVVEHNLLSASRVYKNIGFAALGELLGLGEEKAEETASQMLAQGRVTGSIDQIEGYIHFEQRVGGAQDGGKGGLRKWDAKVQGIVEEVERVASLLVAREPEFAKAQMVQ